MGHAIASLKNKNAIKIQVCFRRKRLENALSKANLDWKSRTTAIMNKDFSKVNPTVSYNEKMDRAYTQMRVMTISSKIKDIISKEQLNQESQIKDLLNLFYTCHTHLEQKEFTSQLKNQCTENMIWAILEESLIINNDLCCCFFDKQDMIAEFATITFKSASMKGCTRVMTFCIDEYDLFKKNELENEGTVLHHCLFGLLNNLTKYTCFFNVIKKIVELAKLKLNSEELKDWLHFINDNGNSAFDVVLQIEDNNNLVEFFLEKGIDFESKDNNLRLVSLIVKCFEEFEKENMMKKVTKILQILQDNKRLSNNILARVGNILNSKACILKYSDVDRVNLFKNFNKIIEYRFQQLLNSADSFTKKDAYNAITFFLILSQSPTSSFKRNYQENKQKLIEKFKESNLYKESDQMSFLADKRQEYLLTPTGNILSKAELKMKNGVDIYTNPYTILKERAAELVNVHSQFFFMKRVTG